MNATLDLERARVTAEHAARAAGDLLLAAFRNTGYFEKAPCDLVTEADLASQRLIASLLLAQFPDHTLMAEEEGVTPDPNAKGRWIVDPLDGTTNFAHGLPLFCTSIALEWEGELVAGAIFLPTTDDLFSAARGAGALRNGRPMRVSHASTLQSALIATGFPTQFEHDADRQLAWFRRFNINTHSVRRTGSSAWNLAMLADGAFDVCYGSDMNPWDAAAGVLLIREAGGHVTALNGQPFSLYEGGLLASNGLVHAAAVEAAQQAWPHNP